MNISSTISIIITSLIPWTLILYILSVTQKWSRPAFIAVHYLADILLFGIAFFIAFKFGLNTKPFDTMLIAMSTLLITEFITWTYFYKGELWFLNWIDWIVPAFLVATTIYFIAKLF